MVWHMHWDTSRRTWYSNPSGCWLPFLCGAMCFSLRHALCCLPIVPRFIGGTDCIRFSRSWNVIGFRATGEFPTSLVLGLISSELRWGAVQYVRSRTDLQSADFDYLLNCSLLRQLRLVSTCNRSTQYASLNIKSRWQKSTRGETERRDSKSPHISSHCEPQELRTVYVMSNRCTHNRR